MRSLAGTGATQRVAQQQLQTQHGVVIGSKQLRALAEHVGGRKSEALHEYQGRRLLVDQANRSAGGRQTARGEVVGHLAERVANKATIQVDIYII